MNFLAMPFSWEDIPHPWTRSEITEHEREAADDEQETQEDDNEETE